MDHPSFNVTDVQFGGMRSLIYASDVQEWVNSLGTRPEDVHKSIFRYDKKIREYARKQGNTTKNYRGQAYADYLPIEIDGDTLEESGKVAQEVLSVVHEQLEITREAYSLYYSGNRGYHILLPVTLFGEVEPTSKFHEYLSDLAISMLEDTDLVGYQDEHNAWRSSSVDLGVFAPQHMLRIPNTVHESSGLFKAPIVPDMLSRPKEVRDRAGEPRPIVRPEPEKSKKAEKIGQLARERLQNDEAKSNAKSGSFNPEEVAKQAMNRGAFGPGSGRYAAQHQQYLDILEAGMVDGELRGGQTGRRKALLKLVGHFKYMGFPKDEATAILELWNKCNEEPLDDQRFYETIRYSYD